MIELGHEIEENIKERFHEKEEHLECKDSSETSSDIMNEYSFNLHEMKAKLFNLVQTMSNFQVYQFISLNPLLIDDEELAIVNDRDDLKNKYKDEIGYEESKSSFGEDSSMMSSNRRNHEFDGGIKRKSTLR